MSDIREARADRPVNPKTYGTRKNIVKIKRGKCGNSTSKRRYPLPKIKLAGISLTGMKETLLKQSGFPSPSTSG